MTADGPDDEELAAAWLSWSTSTWPSMLASEADALSDLANLQEHLAARGFAIVRRLRPPS